MDLRMLGFEFSYLVNNKAQLLNDISTVVKIKPNLPKKIHVVVKMFIVL